jgi:DNA polymerase II small subunit
MESEIKKNIVNNLINADVLVDESILNRLDSITDVNLLNKIKENNELILNENLFNSFKKNNIKRSNVEIIYDYKIPPKKRSYNDFVTLFNKRYQGLMKLLSQRQELVNLVSLIRLKNKPEKDAVAVIGMVSDISKTKNGHYMIILEDDTGSFKFLVSANTENKEMLEIVNSLVLDEVIGVTGFMGNNIVFCSSIILPDVPLSKEFKKSPVEEYAVFIGDMHFGSKYFLQEDFNRFKKWLKGEIGGEKQKKIVEKIRYLIITGDIVEGVGIYPGQDADLNNLDIFDQYNIFTEFVKELPDYINVIICPGNHDAVRIAEPQPKIPEKYLPELYKMENVYFISSPGMVNIGKTDNFTGFDMLLYHGYSFIHYADVVPEIRQKGGQERVDLVMKFLLQRRHLAPTHGSTLYIPETSHDPLIIKKIPDFFVTGHIHRATYSNYRNVSLINTSTWVGMTDYQEKLGLHPQPAKVFLVNLQTRNARMLNFESKKN